MYWYGWGVLCLHCSVRGSIPPRPLFSIHSCLSWLVPDKFCLCFKIQGISVTDWRWRSPVNCTVELRETYSHRLLSKRYQIEENRVNSCILQGFAIASAFIFIGENRSREHADLRVAVGGQGVCLSHKVKKRRICCIGKMFSVVGILSWEDTLGGYSGRGSQQETLCRFQVEPHW